MSNFLATERILTLQNVEGVYKRIIPHFSEKINGYRSHIRLIGRVHIRILRENVILFRSGQYSFIVLKKWN